jgi:hypothetical protein
MAFRFSKPSLVLLLVLLHLPLCAQTGVWRHWKENRIAIEPKSISLPAAQRAALVRRIASRAGKDAHECEGQELKDLLEGLNFSSLAIPPNRNLILVEAGSGCARGGQGANGSMWLFRFDGATPVLLATPTAGFAGWLFSVQKTEHAGMPDIILGWHMSAAETGLTYLRFDGTLYRTTGTASLETDGEGHETLSSDSPKP